MEDKGERHVAALGEAEREGADETSHSAKRVADGGKPGNVGQDVSQPKELEPTCFANEMDWLFTLMPDKWLLKMRDVISFRIDKEEYYRNPECKISCGTMRYIIHCIDSELKWRREHNVQIEY